MSRLKEIEAAENKGFRWGILFGVLGTVALQLVWWAVKVYFIAAPVSRMRHNRMFH